MGDYYFTNRVNLGEMGFWDPWIGCTKISEACDHCYYCPKFDRFSVFPYRHNVPEDLPYGTVIVTAFKTDFFIEYGDIHRERCWEEIRNHPQYIFLICTKRVSRIVECLPADWSDGYDNVVIMVTTENQKRVEERIPEFLKIPCKHRWIAAMPLLEPINIKKYLIQGIEHVEVGGERASNGLARPLSYDWVVNLAEQCSQTNTRMSFMAVGSKFIMDDEVYTNCGSACYHSRKADSLELDVAIPLTFKLCGEDFILK